MIAGLEIGGLIRAAGKASRMGFREKALIPLHGKPLIQHVFDLAEPQVQSLVVSVNRNPRLYHGLGHPLVPGLSKIVTKAPWLEFTALCAGLKNLQTTPLSITWLASPPMFQCSQRCNSQTGTATRHRFSQTRLLL